MQMKGTDICADVHCLCGATTHVDGDFAYNVRCGECKRLYAVNPHIQLVEVEEADIDPLESE